MPTAAPSRTGPSSRPSGGSRVNRVAALSGTLRTPAEARKVSGRSARPMTELSTASPRPAVARRARSLPARPTAVRRMRAGPGSGPRRRRQLSLTAVPRAPTPVPSLASQPPAHQCHRAPTRRQIRAVPHRAVLPRRPGPHRVTPLPRRGRRVRAGRRRRAPEPGPRAVTPGLRVAAPAPRGVAAPAVPPVRGVARRRKAPPRPVTPGRSRHRGSPIGIRLPVAPCRRRDRWRRPSPPSRWCCRLPPERLTGRPEGDRAPVRGARRSLRAASGPPAPSRPVSNPAASGRAVSHLSVPGRAVSGPPV